MQTIMFFNLVVVVLSLWWFASRVQCKLITKYISWNPFAWSVLKANFVVILTAVGFRLVKLAGQIGMFSCKMKCLEMISEITVLL